MTTITSRAVGAGPARRPTSILLVALLSAACAERGGAPALEVERYAIGDTVVVRTVGGSVWGVQSELVAEVRIGELDGEDHYMFGQVQALAVAADGSIYVMDGQVPALRKYAPDGRYLATFGRGGSGPGEYRQPDGGLAVLPDGRVVVRDPGNARLQVYAADGEPLASWPARGGFSTSNPMVVDTAGRVHTQVLLDPMAAVTDWRMGMVAHDGATGEPLDTLPAPVWDFDAPRLVARQTGDGGTSTSVNSVPFSPAPSWAFSPLGHMVGGLSARYAIDQYLEDGTVVRIERDHEPVQVSAGEKANREEQVRWNMRRTQPDWRWNGPPVPDVKPPFQRIYVGRDGGIWVQLHQPGEPIPDDEIDEPRDPGARPPTRWREPVAFDVFDPDGTYLGRARAPRGFSPFPTPVFDGDRVWAVVRDDLDVPYVVRFRVARPGADGAGR
jgi:hypothetical protein